MKGLVAVIIPNYNGISVRYRGKPILRILFDSIKKTSYKNRVLILADDHSTDRSVEFVKRNFPDVAIVKNRGRTGFASNNNSAIRYVMRNYRPDYVLLLNDDIRITDRDWLSKMVSAISSRESVGIEGCKLVYPSGKIQHSGLAAEALLPYNAGRGEVDRGQYDKVAAATAVTFACALIRRSLIERIGLLDERFVMGYEDTDYCIRAKRAGFGTLYNGKVSLEHLEGSTTSSSGDPGQREKRFYDNQRNGAYFIFKYYGPLKRMSALSMLLAASFISIEGKDRPRALASVRLYDMPFRRLGLTLRAFREGYKVYKGGLL